VAAFLFVTCGARGLEERGLGGIRLARVGVRPLLGGLKAAAPVQLSGVSPCGAPLLGGGGEMPADPLALAILVQPAAESRPRPGDCLVRDLQRVLPSAY
jgi:hypothetical protein